MILHHIAYHPGLVVVSSACANAFVLRGGDLHMVDIVVIPDGLKTRIGKAEDEHVLHRFFPEVVINPVELLLADHLKELTIQGACRGFIISKRLFDDQPPPAATVLQE
jgi:hypothetical protein